MSHITATFKTKRAAEEALSALEDIGVTDEQIGLLVTDATRGSTLAIETDDKTEEGFATGAASGGLIGGLIGSGINEHEAVVLENDVKEGGILLAVNPKDNDQREEIKHLLEKEDAYHLAA